MPRLSNRGSRHSVASLPLAQSISIYRKLVASLRRIQISVSGR